MPNILDTVQISGSSYDLKDKNAPSVSAVTQQEYDNLPSSAKTSNTFFVITDATAGDLTQYWTSAQTQSAINQATSGKVNTSSVVSSVTSASTDNEIPTAKAVYDAIPQGGGSITIDPTLDSGSTNAVANSAITTAINGRQLKGEYVGSDAVFVSSDTVYGRTIYHPMFRCYSNNSTNTELVLNNKDLGLYFPTVNGKKIFSTNKYETDWLGDVIEASAITTSISSSSTDTQVPSAKAVNDKLGGLSLVKLTQSEYDALATKDSNVLYVIVG